ncbi:MAG: hypothetical protein HDT46_07530 [Ruminococcaceae bacterium]|nr:hypothetical protein [Oscillospiraceae bacterium]
MKTSNKINTIFRFIAIFFLFCYLIIQIFRSIFGLNIFSGAWYFTASTIVYSIGIILGVAYLIMYLFLFRKYEIKYGILCLINVIIWIPFLIYGSLDYYKDLYNGKIEFETEIYEIPVESYYESHPDRPKEILLTSYNSVRALTISDEVYIDLITNNPLDNTRQVYNAPLDQTVEPHLHHIIIKFYENTKIVDSVQIVYDE